MTIPANLAGVPALSLPVTTTQIPCPSGIVGATVEVKSSHTHTKAAVRNLFAVEAAATIHPRTVLLIN
jgi:hypothetical protein